MEKQKTFFFSDDNSRENIFAKLKTLDLFGFPIQFKVNGNSKINTYFGLIISLVIYGITISLIFTLGNELLDKKKPNSNLTLKYNTNAPLINFTEYDILLPIYLADNAYKPITDASIVSYEILMAEYFRNKTSGVVTKIKSSVKNNRCKDYYSYFEARNFSYDFSANSLTNATCFDSKISQDKNIIIGGNFNQEYYSELQIYISKCNNATEKSKNSGVVCKTKDQINQAIYGTSFEFYYIDKYVDLIDFNRPFLPYFTNYFTRIHPDINVFTTFRFMKLSIISDYGIVFEDKQEIQTITFENSYEQTIPNNGQDTLLKFVIMSSYNQKIYTRLYLKFADLAASIGGIIKILMVIAGFLLSIPNEFSLYEYFINSTLFKINIEDFDKGSNLKLVKSKSVNNESNTKNGKRTIHNSNIILNSEKNFNELSNINVKKYDDTQITQDKNNKLYHIKDSINQDSHDNPKNRSINQKQVNNYFVEEGTSPKIKRTANNSSFRKISTENNAIITSNNIRITNNEQDEKLNKYNPQDDCLFNKNSLLSTKQDLPEKALIKKFKSELNKIQNKKFEFGFLNMMKISLFSSSRLIKDNKMKNILVQYSNIHKFFDYYYILKILRDSFFVKKIFLNDYQKSILKVLRKDIFAQEFNNDKLKKDDISNILDFYLSIIHKKPNNDPIIKKINITDLDSNLNNVLGRVEKMED